MKTTFEKILSDSKSREKGIKIFISLSLAIGFLYLFSPFVGPLLLSVVFAFAIEPSLASFSQKKINRLRYACLFLIFTAIALSVAPFILVSILSYSEFNHISVDGLSHSYLYQSFQHSRSLLISSLESVSAHLKVQSSLKASVMVDQGIQQLSNYLTNAIPTLIANLPSLALSFIVFNIALFLFLFRARSIKAMYMNTHFLKLRELNYVIYSLQSSCRATLVSTVLVGVMHATLFSLGSLVFHLGDPLFVFPITFLCSFLPVVGTLPVTFTLIGMGVLDHRPSIIIGFLVIALLSSALDYWMRVHWMVNESKRIHPALSFIGLLGAIIHFGLPGVIYGPLCISLAAIIIPKFMRVKNHSVIAALKEDEPEMLPLSESVPIHPMLSKPELERRPWIN